MAPAALSKLQLKTSFQSVRTLESIYTGGKVALSSDGKLLVTTVQEDIDIVEVDTGKKVHRLKGDSEIITTFALTPDDARVVSASRSLLLKVWNVATGSCDRQWKAHEAPVIVMDVDATSTLVATGSADSTVKVWDIDRGYCTHNFRGHRGVVSALLFYVPPPSVLDAVGRGKKKGAGANKTICLFSGSEDCSIRLWNLNTSSAVFTLDGHVSVVRGLSVTPDGTRLVSGARDKIVHVWNVAKKRQEVAYTVFESLESIGLLEEGTVLPDGTLVAGKHIIYTGGEKGYIQFWDLSNGQCIYQQNVASANKRALTDVIYSRSTNSLISITSDQTILFHSLTAGFPLTRQIAGYNEEVVDVAFVGPLSPDGAETLLAVATNSEQVRIYDLERFDCTLLSGHTDIVLCLDRSRDGRILVTGSKDKTARIWSVDPLAEDKVRELAVCTGHAEALGAVALCRKEKNFLLTGSQDRTVKMWDTSGIASVRPGEKFQPKSVYTHKAHDKDINAIAVAPNDKIFATGSQDKTAKIWTVADCKLLGTCTGHKRGVWSLQFSPVDQCLATASGDKTVKLWSVADFTCLKTFEGHTNTVLKVHFLTSGMQLVSSASDGLVKLWTIRTSECAATLDNHTEKVWALAVRGDEKHIASGGADSVVNIWEDFTEAEREAKEKEREILVEKYVVWWTAGVSHISWEQAGALTLSVFPADPARQQDLANYLLKKDYRNAISLAMALEQPGQLLTLFSAVMANRPDGDTSVTGSLAVDAVLASMSVAEAGKLLGYVRDWNTNAKVAFTAQTVLQAILSHFDPRRLEEAKDIKELLAGIAPYTERHLVRADALLQQSFIVDFTLKEMSTIIGTVDELDERESAGAEDSDADMLA
ncbi:MAG: quinon protein alcohol dehydrogenase-like superfamily [Olpidium bornovanus]|uniref:Quinon protein alcohol dehydrogenase-like superfamily n=1 Tax=Olpidium bornovanus TaxID=278681 RepID=A0A8H7ZTD2_9FUNG|nr:MAG: quinon protein alcohol dehydrogenase-like superfamily [Olpidium bornovanus]